MFLRRFSRLPASPLWYSQLGNVRFANAVRVSVRMVFSNVAFGFQNDDTGRFVDPTQDGS